MKTVYKIGLGVMCMGLFLGLAGFGVGNASTVNMMLVNGSRSATINAGQSITVTWSAPSGYSYCNTGVSPALPNGWGSYINKPTSGSYTIIPTVSMRFQLQCAVSSPGPMVIEDGVSVTLRPASATQCNDGLDNDNDQAMDYPADFSCSSATDDDEANPKSQCQDGADNDGDNLTDYPADPGCSSKQDNTETNSTIACTTNAQCPASSLTGSATCSGNSIYQNRRSYVCDNAGTTSSVCRAVDTNEFQSNCASNQTCGGAGVCTNNTTGTIACTTNAQCPAAALTGSATCSGNSIYQNYRSYVCDNAGTTSSVCRAVDSYQFQSNCASNQTCSGLGVCVNNAVANTCVSYPYQQCIGNAVYSINSCNGQQSFLYSCGANQTCSGNTCINTYIAPACTSHYSYQCSGNGIYWYNSCGAREELYQACNSNQTCSGNVCVNQSINYNYTQNYGTLSLSVQVRNLSSGNLNWSTSVAASPSDIVQYSVTVKSGSNNYANNVTVKDILPSNLYYNNNVMIDGLANSGSIISGINLGSLSYNQTKTITYQAQVAPAQNFSFGTTSLYNAASASSSDAYNIPGTGNAAVVVTRSGVLGATTVSTGLTNNFLIDSFFLPLLLALAGLWLWKTGLMGKFAFAGAKSQNILENKIAEIKKQENR